MSGRLSPEKLDTLIQNSRLEDLSFADLVRFFREEFETSPFIPNGCCEIDLRTGDRVLFNDARSKRPFDNLEAGKKSANTQTQDCYICSGETTGVVDVAELSDGFTFINKNLYPALYTFVPSHDQYPPAFRNAEEALQSMRAKTSGAARASGFHFLQWTTSIHTVDWHNLSWEDGVVVISRLAALERKLLTPEGLDGIDPGQNEIGYVSIIKNYGSQAGASLSHGHQQITYSDVMPAARALDMDFANEQGTAFSEFILNKTPRHNVVADYNCAVLVVPYFMKRPYDMMLIMKDSGKRYLHELEQEELEAVALGWHEAVYAMSEIMKNQGKEVAYTVLTHNGPSPGIYFEFLPLTQTLGGLERLGLFVSQGDPQNVAEEIKEVLDRKKGAK